MVDLNSITPIIHHSIQQPRFTCTYCKHTFTTESRYMAHECTQLKKTKEFKTPQGQTAWVYYQKWHRYSNKPIPTSNGFITSRYFRTFINFVKFAQSVCLPFPDKFIWYACEQKFTPIMWSTDEVYVRYIEFIDTQTDPLELVKQTISVFYKISETHNMDISNVFTVIDPYDLIHWIRIRRVTPWVLLKSKAFKQFFIDTMNAEQQAIIGTLMRPSFWAEQFQTQPEVVEKIKRYLAQLEL